MSKRPLLRKLLPPPALRELLSRYRPLLGDAPVGVFDAQGQLLDGQVALSTDTWRRLWPPASGLSARSLADEGLTAWPLTVERSPLGLLVVQGSLSALARSAAEALVTSLETVAAEVLARRAIAQETLERYREVNLLYNIGEVLGAYPDLEQVCRHVLAESMRLINCRRGAVLLVAPEAASNAAPPLRLVIGVGLDGLSDAARQAGWQLALQGLQSGRPQIVNDFQPPGMPRMPVVYAPLRFRKDRLGVILLAEKARQADFTAADEKLLLTLATQAASFIRNARLYQDVLRQRDEIATIKRYMDNIFASIASGVITINLDDQVTSFNRAAGLILGLSPADVLHHPYRQALQALMDSPLPRLIQVVQLEGRTFTGVELTPHLPERGTVNLTVNLAPLRSSSGEPLGVAIVVDDVTEKTRLERQQRIVRRYLPPELVDALPDELADLSLRGERQTITTLFADIRGFTTFSEAHTPERVVQVINQYFDLATQTVRRFHGIIDKYLGDAVMALFNPPLLPRPDHAWRAVQAAWHIQKATARLHRTVAPEECMYFGIGICTGEAVVGNVGTLEHLEYTAIGDAVNIAKRLQENAEAGRILMSRSTWEQVKGRVVARRLPPLKLKGRQTVTQVYELVTLRNDHPPAGSGPTGG